jgi:hypothetical protein
MTTPEESQWQETMERLAAAGFTDLDLRKGFVLVAVASALKERPLRGFEDVNERIGSRFGLGSGIVRHYLGDLKERGYVTISPAWAVELTAKGADASECLDLPPRT